MQYTVMVSADSVSLHASQLLVMQIGHYRDVEVVFR